MSTPCSVSFFLSNDSKQDTSTTNSHHRWELPGNYPNFQKYGNLPLSLENYALFSLPSIFTNILYTYPLSYIVYLGEPSGNIISNYHGTFIHIYMHWYDPMFKIYIWNSFFPRLMLPFFLSLSFFLPIIHLKSIHLLQV